MAFEVISYDSRPDFRHFFSACELKLYRIASAIAFLIPLVAGCQGPSWYAQAIDSSVPSGRQSSSNLLGAAVPAAENPSEKTSEEAMAEVLDELEEIGSIDPQAKSELMADLREAKPENWPMIVRQYRSALAYRRQLIEREEKAAAETLATQEPKIEKRVEQASLPVEKSVRESPTAIPVSFEKRQTSTVVNNLKLATSAETSSAPAIPSAAALAESSLTQTLSQPPAQLVRQASYSSSDREQLDRHEHLESAIADWQSEVKTMPGSTDEVNEHLRLRLLQLLAGNEEAALLPVPGATAAQQDYWSKQLFAVSTFLDNEHQPNDKQRAAGSLMHLDQARAKLAELATMQVRKLAFVDSVEGYGAYQLHEQTEFRPGDQVTLYAEIDNFRSESTKKGYRTLLGTSYEVVDKNGKRVDSAQFPEVEDLCQNVRRDFHMQYTVTLPTRIYPEDYELRLIITDQLSHKIGQASIPFKIVE